MTFSVYTQLSKHHVLEKQEKGNHADEDLSAIFESHFAFVTASSLAAGPEA